MFFSNPHAMFLDYPPALHERLNLMGARACAALLAGWEHMHAGATPLWPLPALAQRLGLGEVWVKDESVRSPLGSFKALGAPVALVRLIVRLLPSLEPERVLQGAYRSTLAGFTCITATDGNHGRALAAAVQSAGCRCVIVLHAHVSAEREQAIAAYGAEIVRVAGNYDDSVAEAARLAAAHGWHVVSDTSYEGYETIPCDVMQGYGILVDELPPAAPDGAAPFTHVFVQGGVGALPGALAAHLMERYGRCRPYLFVVEPQQADCLYQSARQDHAASASGSVDSVMAGLACGEASPLAWRFLRVAADGFLTVTDDRAIAAMRTLAAGEAGDIPIVSGESGAATLAGLETACADDGIRTATGLDSTARVLLISSEGDTAPATYRDLVGESGDSVRARQAAWRAE